MDTIGFIGSGNMAEAMINGILKANVYRPGKVYVSDIRPERLEYLREHYGVRVAVDNAELAANSDIIVLSVKPQNMTDALQSIKGAIKEEALVISIAAGIHTDNISAELGDVAIVRVMPNMPAWVDEGASALFANEKAKTRVEIARLIFLSVGEAVVIEDESMLDAITAVSGSGPAYFFLLMDEMIKTGIELGLPEDIAKELVLQTGKGATLLAEKAAADGDSPAQLVKKVATPGGTTEAAFNVFNEGKFGPMVENAIKRACERSRELSRGSG
ncbi:MAG: pyrroline-5-carboxylate reductase [Planctomycetes bacterium]|nr:pyrroline-5-carboxylate reductase [Planctomycetota bacterium]